MTQFYQITLEKAIADYKLGKLTTFGLVDYYIRIKFAPGWKISIDPQKSHQRVGDHDPSIPQGDRQNPSHNFYLSQKPLLS